MDLVDKLDFQTDFEKLFTYRVRIRSKVFGRVRVNFIRFTKLVTLITFVVNIKYNTELNGRRHH